MTSERELTVLHVLEAVEGGTARHVVDIVQNTPEVSHEVALPVSRSEGVTDRRAIAQLQERCRAVHVLPLRRTPWSPANLKALARLVALVRRRRPWVIHGHSSVGGAIARAAAGSTPRVYTPNGITSSALYLKLERALGRRTDALVAVSKSEADLARELHLVPAERIRLIPNGIDLEGTAQPGAIDLRLHLALAPGTPIVGTVARLVPQKAPEGFVKACAEVAARRPEVHFLLIGSGPLQPSLDASVREAGLIDRFHQIPELPSASSVLAQLDVVTLLSRYEGGPYAPLESMRAGTPVVLSDVVGNRDVVQDGVSGFVVPFGSASAAADAIVRVIGDPALRSRLVEAGYSRLAECFDVRVMGRRYADLYVELAAAGR